MSNYRTHYDNLKVARNAPDAVIRAAYKALMQKYHPDKFEGNEQEALRIAKIIKQSFDILIDPVKRAEHDRWIDEKKAKASSKVQFEETANAAEQQFTGHPSPPKGSEPPPSNWGDEQSNQKYDNSSTKASTNSEINTHKTERQWFVALMMIVFILAIFPVQKINVNNKQNKDGAIKSILKWIFVLILIAFVIGGDVRWALRYFYD